MAPSWAAASIPRAIPGHHHQAGLGQFLRQLPRHALAIEAGVAAADHGDGARL